jgi:hypothetical protein
MITLKILDSEATIEKNVNAAIAEEVNGRVFRNQQKLLQKCKSLVSGWITSQPEILSLQSNDIMSLAGQFGLYPGQENNAITTIINSVESSITVKFTKFTPKLVGGIEVNFQPNNFLNLLNLPQGIVNYGKGTLHWLDWLLTKGDSIIVVSYQYNPTTGLGRSGLGNMIGGGSFRVPPQFSGTKDNNFITRALVGPQQEQQIANIFKEILGA